MKTRRSSSNKPGRKGSLKPQSPPETSGHVLGNHEIKMARLILDGKLDAGVTRIIVRHDHWCPSINGGISSLCICDPEIEISQSANGL